MAAEQDIVLIYYEDSPLTFARIESIEPDIKRGWYHVKLLMLQIPLQVVTWILRDVYIDGETFTMEGKEMRLEKIECPESDGDEWEGHYDELEMESDNEPVTADKTKSGGKIISLSDLKKK
jgi:hypothetical protein